MEIENTFSKIGNTMSIFVRLFLFTSNPFVSDQIRLYSGFVIPCG